MTTVLCLHHAPDDLRGILEDRFPDVTVGYAATNAEIAEKLAALEPDVVFSIKGPEFPGNEHYQAVEAPSVKWIQVGGSGYDHIQPFNPAKITVTNCAGVLARHLSETTTGAMLAINGNFFPYHRQQQRKEWRAIPFRPLAGQTLLVVGLGHIGSWVARNAKALGMRVHAIKRSHEDLAFIDQLFDPAQLHEALPEADFVSLHVRATPDTHHMMNAAAFAAMKPGAVLLNTARGAVVDTTALMDALESGTLGGAYLDVFEQEPLPSDHPLWGHERVFMMPHASDNIANWPTQFGHFFADNLDRWMRGEPLINQVAG